MKFRDTWLLFDPHFNHRKIITFKQRDGVTPLRDFATIEEMNETIIENYNKVVKPGDKVYFGGDVGTELAQIMPRLPGRRQLIVGNHDHEPIQLYAKWFRKIALWKYVTPDSHGVPLNMIVTHAPLHKVSFYYKSAFCVHGHIHMDEPLLGRRYLNLACELVGYRPVHVEEAADMILKRLDANPCKTCGNEGFTGGPDVNTMEICPYC